MGAGLLARAALVVGLLLCIAGAAQAQSISGGLHRASSIFVTAGTTDQQQHGQALHLGYAAHFAL
jgi:hypothetical protein